jgi:hypothetical protein
MALAGCGSASGPSTPAHAVMSIESQCSAGADEFRECVITLTDTRKVTASSTRATSRAACHATGAM